MILALPGEQVKILVILLYLVSVLDMMGHVNSFHPHVPAPQLYRS